MIEPARTADSAPASGSQGRLQAAPLERLRRRLRGLVALADEAELEKFAGLLRDDPRQGAQQLARSALRQLDISSNERQRVERMFELRRSLYDAGYRRIAGVDEVGVGPLAGPVVAAAVILPECIDLPGVNDSKKLKAPVREKLALAIRERAVAVSIGEVSPQEIDRLNIYAASLEAMRRAVAGLAAAPDFCLVDARTIPGIAIRQQALIHGDAIDGSIAAASIVAKVHRDRIMAHLDVRHPGYGFARHKGYGTAVHLDALARLGASPVHRRSFAPVARSFGRATRATKDG